MAHECGRDSVGMPFCLLLAFVLKELWVPEFRVLCSLLYVSIFMYAFMVLSFIVTAPPLYAYSTTGFKFLVHSTTVGSWTQSARAHTFVFSNLPTPSGNAFPSEDCRVIKHRLVSCIDAVSVGHSIPWLLEERGLPETV